MDGCMDSGNSVEELSSLFLEISFRVCVMRNA